MRLGASPTHADQDMCQHLIAGCLLLQVELAELLALIAKDPRVQLDFLSKAPHQGGPDLPDARLPLRGRDLRAT